MQRVLALVEGQTEESFVNRVLGPHLTSRGLWMTPIVLTTKRVRNRSAYERAQPGRRFKGGVSRYTQVRRDVRNCLKGRSVYVTTMLDFYGLPADFPGMDRLPPGDGYAQVCHLEEAFHVDIGDARFRPFLTLHEFEALLFSQPTSIAAAFPEQKVAQQLEEVRAAFASPEEINQGINTHPSARLVAQVIGYRKPLHGALIAERIGLDQMRRQCPHFAEWVTWLEAPGT